MEEVYEPPAIARKEAHALAVQVEDGNNVLFERGTVVREKRQEDSGKIESLVKEVVSIRPKSPSTTEIGLLKKEMRALRFENDALHQELETTRDNVKLSSNAFQNLRENVRAVLDRYTADQRQSEVELQGLDQQAKDIIERIQIVANRLEEDSALLVEKLREAVM